MNTQTFQRLQSEATKKRSTMLKIVTGMLLGISGTLLFLNIFGSQEQNVSKVMNLATFNQWASYGQCNLFADTGFGGRKIVLYPGYKGNLGNLQPGFNDELSSIQIGSGLRVLFCSNNNCEGNEWSDKFELLGPYNAPFLSVNDWVSYIEVYNYDENVDPRVMIIGGSQFNIDRSGTFPPGQYFSADLKRNGIDIPRYPGGASSIVVPKNLIAYVYKQDYLQGEMKTINGPAQIDLTTYEGGAWNDNIGSMVISKLTFTPIVITGYWYKVIASTDQISASVETTSGISTTKTNSQEIQASLSLGFEVGSELIGQKASISGTVAKAVSRSVDSTLSQSGTYKIQAQCSNPQRVKMSLWQWRMSGIKNGVEVMDMKDNEFICKTGDQSPRCPVGFCQDNECTICKPGTYQ
ncbi:UNKNOWN [Stylonychia lemnae]|uniref:Uncharacterized protein n=1 Tax=Stylonychia lemnae TaxID=5949 RepID=A0A078A185_STYLE|nr:UNKNOWN [Stylonychia lemnae]|eukprot:CDW75612.1 UNKNOWN [Stylonychia lemnae]